MGSDLWTFTEADVILQGCDIYAEGKQKYTNNKQLTHLHLVPHICQGEYWFR